MILWIDDEPRYISSYVDELALAGFAVTVQNDIDMGVAYFRANKETIALCVLDIMISPGKLFQTEDTLLGRRTGFHLFDHLRAIDPELRVIVLTNVNAPDIERKFGIAKHCWWFRKDQCLPYELVQQIRQILV